MPVGMDMNLDLNSILAGVLFGLVGLYVFRAAKRDGNLLAVSMGLALMIYPYFVSGPWLTWGLGVALSFFSFRALRDS